MLSELCKQRETRLGESTQPTSRDSQRQPVCFCTRAAFDQADSLGFLGVSSRQCPLAELVHCAVCVVCCVLESELLSGIERVSEQGLARVKG